MLALLSIGRWAWPYVIAALAGAWLASYPAHWAGYREGVKAGREALIAEQRKEADRRTHDAEEADRALRDCVAHDRDCIMRNDGNRRD
jgi:hypothetical protein